MTARRWCQEGRQRWPRIKLSEQQLAEFAGEEIADERGLDVFLACACGLGDAEAVAVFRARFDRHIRAIAGRVDPSPEFVDEVHQQLIERLLVSDVNAPPRISSYSGRGELLAFVRAATSRCALNLARTRRRRREISEVDDAVASPADDPEILYLKQHYREQFREAFAAAAAELEPSERMVLRFSVSEQLSIDHIARVLQVHRATAARRVARARERLAEKTQAQLRALLGIEHSELESVLRLVHSQVDVSVQRLLRDEGQ